MLFATCDTTGHFILGNPGVFLDRRFTLYQNNPWGRDRRLMTDVTVTIPCPPIALHTLFIEKVM